MTTDIDDLYRQAIGGDARPFAYQRRIAESGLPELLDIPTGCGKTPAILLGWLYRRFHHPDAAVRSTTPTRLIWCLPLRTLSRQTAELAALWVDRLGLDAEIDIHLLMGGEPVPHQQWRLNPHRCAIIVSTLDMALSRALNRGYLASRYAWPIDFALFNDDCHWVFDEIQLMGVALPTSRQLHGLRNTLGVRSRHSSTWMSATVDRDGLTTVDAPETDSTIRLDQVDRVDPELTPRLSAPKRLIRRQLDDTSKYARSLAGIVCQEHVDATLTVVVVNSVKVAKEVAQQVRKAGTDDDAVVILLHSRFRRADRDAAFEKVIEGPTDGRGLIVVSTQVIEAGMDLSARTLITECAPWSSVVQRAGRCNRWGDLDDARVVVVNSSDKGPYESSEVEQSWELAGKLHESIVTPETLAAERLPTSSKPGVALRRKDLLDLFDTTADLAGNDIDVSRFIRADGDLDVSVAWRDGAPDRTEPPWPRVSRGECCPVPIGEFRDWFTKTRPTTWVYDALERQWRRARQDDLRPGAELVVECEAGGYDPEIGFDAGKKAPVEPIDVQPSEPTPDDDRDIGSDPFTTELGRPVALTTHLLDAEHAAQVLCDELHLEPGAIHDAICSAARLHDLGKAHPVFQGALHERSPGTDADVTLAKSATKGRLGIPKDRSGFRHELASVAMLDANPHLITVEDTDLVRYLVGAHHGRVRMGIRSLPMEPANQVLGLQEGDEIPATDIGNGSAAGPTTVELSMCRLGGDGTHPSWSSRAADLLAEHGPFRLAWMEAAVRIADWRASIEGAG